MGEKSAIVKSVDANVPPDQPPSPVTIVDSPATLILWRGLSATGITFRSFNVPTFSAGFRSQSRLRCHPSRVDVLADHENGAPRGFPAG